MDYEQKYKEALKRARELQENSNGMILKKWLWAVFPELVEPEDERIRKEIIDFLGLPHPQFVGKRDHEKWIAWLEKQKATGEEIIFRPIVGTDIRIAAKQALEKIDIGKKVVLAFNGAYIPVNGKTVGEIDSEYDAWIEKQGKKTNPYSGVSFEYNGYIWGMCARDNGVDILLDKQLFKHLDTQGETKPKTWRAEDEQNLNVVLSFIEDERLRRWLKDKLCYDTLDADKVIAWLVANICDFEYYVKLFKKDFGL